ncbi:MAG: threonine/serine exporter family protein [Oscillospiraceae bacterium]|nr:threonine/serine exporter family protein [Oscillospiraceae bacterium]
MYYLPCLWAFFACAAFCLVYNIRGKILPLSSLGGALGWFVYLSLNFLNNDIFQFFFATIATAVYSEVMARIYKKPATEFQIVALLPMVPGGGIFYTMEYCVIGNNEMFLKTGLHTLGIAGALALGILLVSSLFRIRSAVPGTKK